MRSDKNPAAIRTRDLSALNGRVGGDVLSAMRTEELVVHIRLGCGWLVFLHTRRAEAPNLSVGDWRASEVLLSV